MLRPILNLVALSISVAPLCFSAGADEAVVTVKPGLWTWNYAATLIGFPITETNTECLTKNNAEISLEAFVKDLQDTCALSNLKETGNATSFVMTCTGNYAGEARGQYQKVSEEEIQMNATGRVTMFDQVEAPFTFKANATYIGDCSVGG